MNALHIPDDKITVFDFTGRIQEGTKGNHFCALAMTAGRYVQPGTIINVAEYLAMTKPTDIRFIDGRLIFDETPARVEHFLQTIRDHFPGKSSQELVIEYIPMPCVSPVPSP